MNETEPDTGRPVGNGGPLFDSGAWNDSFPPTIGLLVNAAHDGNHDAIVQLAHLYATPIFCFLRRKGVEREEAKDLTQDVLARLVSGELLANYRIERGRLRDYLRAALRNLRVSDGRHKNAVKRGGGARHVDLDELLEHVKSLPDTDPELTAEEVYDRQAAREILNAAGHEAQEECDRAGLSEHFLIFAEKYLAPSNSSWRDIGERFNLSEDQARGRAQTAAARFRDALIRNLRLDAMSERDTWCELQRFIDLFRHGA